MDTTKTLEVEAEVVESPRILGEADKWLADTSSRVSQLVESGDFECGEITTDADYRQAKRSRAALNTRIKEIETERKAMTRTVEEAIKAFKDNAKDVLTPLHTQEAALHEAIDAWDVRWKSRRRSGLAQEYEDFVGELADMVSFEAVEAKWSADGKWYNRTTSDAAAYDSLHTSAESIASKLASIDALPYPDERKSSVRAKYLVVLDLARAMEQEEREHAAAEAARAQREAAEARRQEAERRRQEEERAGAEQEAAEAQAREAAAREEQARHNSQILAAEQARARRIEAGQEKDASFTVEFRATVTELQLRELRTYLHQIGIQAKFRRIS